MLKRNKKILGGLVLTVAVSIGFFVGGSVTSALSSQDESDYAQNDILFYESCATSSGSKSACGIAVSGSTIEEKIWSGLTSFMTEEQAAGAMGNMAHEGGFNPARHEDSFITSQPNFDISKNSGTSYGIGLIQWSYGRRIKLYNLFNEQAPALWTKYIDEGRGTYGRLGGADFLKKAENDGDVNTLISVELCRLKQELSENSVYGKLLDKKTVQEAADYFLEKIEVPGNIERTRGTRRQDAQKYYDQFHGGGSTDTATEVTAEGVGSASEVLPTGGNGSGISCNGNNEGSKNLNAAAVALAWPEGNVKKANYNGGSATKAFQDAHKKFTSRSNSCNGADCGLFVSTVVRFSGYDSDYPEAYVPNQYEHVEKHPELWEIIDWSDGDKSKAKPGDIVFENGNGHTMFIVEDSKGEIKYASASQCQYYGKIKNFYAPRQPAKLARAKSANNSTSGVSSTSGVTPSSNDGTIAATGQNNGDINASAIALAWPENKYKSVYKKKATDAFANYYNSLPGKKRSECWGDGKACSIFVNTVLSYAGAKKTGVKKVRDVGTVRKDLEADEDWEEIQPAGDKFKESDLQPGDVIFYYRKKADSRTGVDKWKGLYVNHVAIYVETPEGGRIAQAHHCKAFGYISTDRLPNGKKNVRVYRWKKQGNNTQASCDVCAGESGNGGAVSGGLSMEQAKALMKKYRELPSSQWKTYNLTGYSCPGGPVANCVSFSNYFVQKYTTYGKAVGGDGGVYAKNLASKAGLDHGNEPRPYAVFSKATGSTMCGNHLCGHTGVVLNVDKERNKILIGEAGCSMPNSWTDVHEYDLKAWTGGSNYYAYTDSIMNLDEVNKDAQ